MFKKAKRRMKNIVPILLVVMLMFSTAPVGALGEDSSYGNDIVVSESGYTEVVNENNDIADEPSYENGEIGYGYGNNEVVQEEYELGYYVPYIAYVDIMPLSYVEVSAWEDLRTEITNAAGGAIEIVVTDNLSAINGAIVIPVDTYVTLLADGNWSITNGNASASDAFEVEGTLNLGAGNQSGELTISGFTLGAITVLDGGVFNMYTGAISGNSTLLPASPGNNNQPGWGGGVNVWSGGTFEMYGGTISGNQAGQMGGNAFLIGWGGGVSIFEGTFEMHGGTITGNSAGWGGGVRVNNGAFTMSGGSISGNTALTNGAAGGGVSIVNNSTFIMFGSTQIHNNQASGAGGVHVETNSVFTMHAPAHIYSNDRGGVGVRVGSTFNMYGGTIGGLGNQGNTGIVGAGVSIMGSTFNMSDGAIIGNNSTGRSGGVDVERTGGLSPIPSTFNMTGGLIANNTAVFAGGVTVSFDSTFNMKDGVISDNIAEQRGGGVESIGHIEMTGGQIINNSVTNGNGGGVAILTWPSNPIATFDMQDGIISGNTANNGGGIFLMANSTADLTGGSITNNTARAEGGGIYTENFVNYNALTASDYQNLTIADTVIFSGNRANQAYLPPAIAATYSNIAFDITSLNIDGAYIHPINNYDINFVGDATSMIVTWTVTFLSGTASNSVTSMPANRTVVDDNAVVSAGPVTNPQSAGYTFLGWAQTIPAATGVLASVDVKEITVTQDKTFTAQWRRNQGGGGGGGGGTTPDPELIKTPDRTTVRVGETINWTMRGFQNPTGNTVSNFTIVDMPGQGLNFQSGRLPAFTNGAGITYEIRYTVAGSDEWRTYRTGIDASRPFEFSLPQPGNLHYTNIGFFFGTVPADFGRNNQIVLSFVVGANAPNNVLINRFALRYDNVEREGLSPERPTVIRDIFASDHEAYLVGFPDGSIRPNSAITRAEVATIIFRLLDDDYRAQIWSQNNPFSDVAAANWFNNAVSTLTNASILKGFPDGAFRGNQAITRAEFVAIVARFLEDTSYTGADRFNDIEGHWANEYINVVGQHDWIRGFAGGDFRPNQDITRAEAAAIVNRMLGDTGRLATGNGDLA